MLIRRAIFPGKRRGPPIPIRTFSGGAYTPISALPMNENAAVGAPYTIGGYVDIESGNGLIYSIGNYYNAPYSGIYQPALALLNGKLVIGYNWGSSTTLVGNIWEIADFPVGELTHLLIEVDENNVIKVAIDGIFQPAIQFPLTVPVKYYQHSTEQYNIINPWAGYGDLGNVSAGIGIKNVNGGDLPGVMADVYVWDELVYRGNNFIPPPPPPLPVDNNEWFVNAIDFDIAPNTSVAIPAGTIAGDFMLLIVDSPNASFLSPPAGWSVATEFIWPTYNYKKLVLYRFATGSETDVTIGGSIEVPGCIITYRGVTGFDVAPVCGEILGSFTYPQITTTTENCIVVTSACDAGAITPTIPLQQFSRASSHGTYFATSTADEVIAAPAVVSDRQAAGGNGVRTSYAIMALSTTALPPPPPDENTWFVGATEADGGPGTAIPIPNGTQPGDFMVLIVDSASPMNEPAGWTRAPDGNFTWPSYGYNKSVFYKFAEAGEPSAVPGGGSTEVTGSILAYRGVTGFDVTPVIGESINSVNYPSLTTTTANCIIVTSACDRSPTIPDKPAQQKSRVTRLGTYFGIRSADEVKETPGEVSGRTAVTGSVYGSSHVIMALKTT